MGQRLADRTAAHLCDLAAQCDRIQEAVGDLLDWTATRQADERSGAPGAQILCDLQGLDRIGQLLRDLAEVQHALSLSATGSDEARAARAVQAARLEETRRALAGKAPAPTSANTRPGAPDDSAGGCEPL